MKKMIITVLMVGTIGLAIFGAPAAMAEIMEQAGLWDAAEAA
jgi:hypothetical protein